MADKITVLPTRPHADTQTEPDVVERSSGDAPAWPVYGLIDDLLPVLERWQHEGRRAALATLVDITGSSPRPVGSEMAISDTGEIAGYVSGGCVEGAVAAEAREVLATDKPVLLDYGAGSPVLDVQLTCGGRIRIFVRALPDLGAYVQRWATARSKREALDVGIDLTDGSHEFTPGAATRDERYFHQQYLPPPRLIVAGSDPVTLALCQLASTFGYEVALLRPYGPATVPADTTLCHYDTRPLARVIQDIRIDAWCGVYTLTHDIDDDHAILLRALQSGAFCVGALGSRNKARLRAARLREDGIDDATIARLSTPAGLDIGARDPREIALSILAEMTRHRPREAAARS